MENREIYEKAYNAIADVLGSHWDKIIAKIKRARRPPQNSIRESECEYICEQSISYFGTKWEATLILLSDLS